MLAKGKSLTDIAGHGSEAMARVRARRPAPIDRATNATTHFRIRLEGAAVRASPRQAWSSDARDQSAS